MEWNKKSRNAHLHTIWIDSLTDDVWIRQIDKWKYLGIKEE